MFDLVKSLPKDCSFFIVVWLLQIEDFSYAI